MRTKPFDSRATTVIVLTALAWLLVTAKAADLTITSFSGNGTVTWTYPTNNVAVYKVEWASQADGPWTNFAGATSMLDAITPTGVTMAAAVPMFYRVVATAAPTGMVLIPGGTNAGTDPDFGTYSLAVTSFYMDKYEVTKALWDEVYVWAITNGYAFNNVGSGKAANHPVHTVNWYDVVKWCNARSQKEGRPAVYTVNGAVYKAGQSNDIVQTSAAGYRLPTDMEWEYAARGGATNRRFPWIDSDEIQHARANYYSLSGDSHDTSPTRGFHPTYSKEGTPYTSPVGSFAANGYGLNDMAGNVWEWCFDWYPGSEGSSSVLRGGSWNAFADYCRVGYRNSTSPADADIIVGFRIVLPPGQP